MNEERIDSLERYLQLLETIEQTEVVLFRGQREKKDLLPKIARTDPSRDTTSIEKKMLNEFRRRAPMLLANADQLDDWDLLVHAQHFGMSTRLLDWTQNPLVALWFACGGTGDAEPFFVYSFRPPRDSFMDSRRLRLGPFSQDSTRVLKPMLNNARIVAQEGWFTVHRYSAKALRYVPLNVNTKLHDHLTCFEFPGSLRKPIMQKLSRLGVNHQTVYADVYGLCRHVSWIYGF
jgi:hypothetical protein